MRPATRAVAPPPPWRTRPSLVPLTRVHAVHAAGDAFVAVALADTFFFSVPIGEARSRVALYLLVTMAPFAVVAPVVGPLLDRLGRGRRGVIAVAFLVRAGLAWWMAGGSGGFRIYPAAFGVLVASRAYGVARAAAVPRLLPPDMTLVGAGARLSAASLVGGSTAAAIGAGVSWAASYQWTLRVAAVALVVGAVFAAILPAAVNSPALGKDRERADRFDFGTSLRAGLLALGALRAFAGFLTLFIAFLLRQRDGGTTALAIVVAAAALGGVAGTALGGALRQRHPDRLLLECVGGCAAAAVLAALAFTVATAAVVGFAAGLGGSLGRLAYDAVLQRDVPEPVRGAAFARSETTLQLAWVLGGIAGIALPLDGGLALGLAAAGLVVALAGATRPARR